MGNSLPIYAGEQIYTELPIINSANYLNSGVPFTARLVIHYDPSLVKGKVVVVV